MTAEQETQERLGSVVLAGLGLALVDGLASGMLRTPWRLQALGLCMGLAVGLLAGLVALGIRRRGLGFGLVLAFGAGLNALSLISKELEAGARGGLGALAAGLALLAGAACLGCPRHLANRFLVLASVPAGSLALGLMGASNSSLLLAAGLPLLVAGLTRLPALRTLRGSPAIVSSAVVGVLLTLPVALGDAAQVRPDLEPGQSIASPLAPNLILVIIDTMRADALQQDGPLGQLAQQGARFEQCISTAPWTLPSVSSMLTGLLPSQHGATNAARILPSDVQTLAETLRQAGYQTAAFTGGAFVSQSFQLDQGFEHFDATAEFGFQPYRLHVPLVWRLAKNRFLPMQAAIRWVAEYPGFAGVCEAADRWLAKRDRSRPYFLLLHTYEIHDYYLRHPDVDAGIKPEDFGLSARFRGRLSIHPEELVGAPQGDLDYFEAIYHARLENVEAELDGFLAGLDQDPGRRRALVLTSDHGEGFDAQRGRVHHGGRLHDDLLRVPLLLHAPGLLKQGQVIAESVSTLDLVPTFLEWAGCVPDETLPGSSLLPLTRGEDNLRRALWSEERANGRSLYSLREEGWKLMREGTQYQYFELSSDPFEEQSLPEAPAHLKTRLDSFATSFPAHAGQSSQIDPQTEAHLRSIGYLGDSEEDSD